MTDFRALCQELIDAIDSGVSVELIKQSPLAVRVDAALAQPEPQEPTDEELIELFNENDWNYISPETFLDIARSVLEFQ